MDTGREERKGAGRIFAYVREPLIFLGASVALTALLTWARVGCPIRRIFGVPCPSCGIFRSLSCLLRLDFVGSWHYHPAALPIGAAVALSFVSPFLKGRWKTAVMVFQVSAAAMTAVVYIIRLSAGSIP